MTRNQVAIGVCRLKRLQRPNLARPWVQIKASCKWRPPCKGRLHVEGGSVPCKRARITAVKHRAPPSLPCLSLRSVPTLRPHRSLHPAVHLQGACECNDDPAPAPWFSVRVFGSRCTMQPALSLRIRWIFYPIGLATVKRLFPLLDSSSPRAQVRDACMC